ncbi:hypothetical protein A0O34_15005 [Chryseobacterium glaciei]|uniref:Uncharacterized protein n=1 Tax=Chryseobacterium glaciei TaxID=1685010 RepID=A0A172XXZ2_9FLAO|nr:hypothetical protein [Chryseobacterium glaciei]ANF51732.1 hypothetical protein A0O34_15005 [Chryseobacterium glaciei]
MKTELSKQIKNLNVEELVKQMFPFSENYVVIHKFYTKRGIAGWPTWFIVIYTGELLNDYLLFTICEHSSFTNMKYLKPNFKLDSFIHQVSKASGENELFTFFNKNNFVEQEYFLQVNEMKRLYDYLDQHGIILFEPTE